MSMPRITKGLGSFTARAFNRMSRAVESVERSGPTPSTFNARAKSPQWFFAELTNRSKWNQFIDQTEYENAYHHFKYTWIYSWRQITFDYKETPADPAFTSQIETLAGSSLPTGTLAGTRADNTGAFNIRELKNDGRTDGEVLDAPYMGPGIYLPLDGSIYPEAVDAESEGDHLDQVVLMYRIPAPGTEDTDPQYLYFFDQDLPIKCHPDTEPFRASTLDITLDLGSLATPSLDHSTLDFGGLT